jgi:hypothetical protein
MAFRHISVPPSNLKYKSRTRLVLSNGPLKTGVQHRLGMKRAPSLHSPRPGKEITKNRKIVPEEPNKIGNRFRKFKNRSRRSRDIFVSYFKPMFYLVWPLRPHFPPICYTLAGPRPIRGRTFLKQEGSGGTWENEFSTTSVWSMKSPPKTLRCSPQDSNKKTAI